jgi:hypothetical protein
MSIVDEALNEAALRRGDTCSIAKAKAKLGAGPSTGERGTLTGDQLDELLDSELPASVVARYVSARGLDVREQAVNRHRKSRRGELGCKCPL